MKRPVLRVDDEVLGWVDGGGAEAVVVDLLGRIVMGADPQDAERLLEERGLGYLADPYALDLPDGPTVPVRIVEVAPDRIRVKREDLGAIDGPGETWDLPNPAPPTLGPR